MPIKREGCDMKNFSEIVEEIKDIISADIPGKKVFDKDVASALDITQMNFATMKKRSFIRRVIKLLCKAFYRY